jgi:predicted transposase YbfD/YdcC
MRENFRRPSPEDQAVLASLQVRLLESDEIEPCHRLLDQHHDLQSPKPVGERLYYVVTDAQGQWLALLVFAAAAMHLKYRDRWIGWSDAQREKRLSLVVNNLRFLLVPERTFPNLGTRSLQRVLARLSRDWQAAYGHPVVVVETFVDPDQFCGTVYTANGWEELGKTDGSGRHQRDDYVRHDKPKRLFVRELCRNARRSLQAEHLKPALAMVEAKVGPRSRPTVKEIGSIVQQLKRVPDFRARFESYPLWGLLAIYLMAVLCEAPRGSKDLAKFARKLSQAQRRALGLRLREGRYPAPSQPTFWRLLQEINGTELERVLLAVQAQLRGPAPKDELIAMDGKEPKHGGGQSVLTAVCVPSQYYLASGMVDTKTNEIPVARLLLKDLDLTGRFVSLDALHTQAQTARDLVLEAGADYLLTAKDNQLTVHQTIQKLLPAPKADSPPWQPTPTQFRTLEHDKSCLTSRSILTQPVSAEQICFPLVAQAARLLRQSDGRKDEHICLLTSAEPEKLDAQKWLQLNRAGFAGIENGLHQRLDVSHNDDRCRIRFAPGMFVAGLFRRISNSRCIEWRSHQPRPEYLTTTDFQAAMGEDQGRPALRLLFAKRPSLKPP